MKKQIKLAEQDIKKIISETIKRHLKENNDDYEKMRDAIDRGYEPGETLDTGETVYDPDVSEGFDKNSIPGVEREGGIEDVCRGKFDTLDELKEFLLNLGDVTDSLDLMEKFVKILDQVVDLEGNTYN